MYGNNYKIFIILYFQNKMNYFRIIGIIFINFLFNYLKNPCCIKSMKLYTMKCLNIDDHSINMK